MTSQKRKSSRENVETNDSLNGINHNGFEVVSEEGIFKIDESYYSKFEINNYDEIECHGPYNVGIMRTIDDVYIICTKNDDDGNNIEWKQAIEGG